MTRTKTIVATLAASLAVLLGTVGPASAAYPPSGSGTIDIQAEVGSPAAGATVVVSIEEGFCPVPGTWTLTLTPGDVSLGSGDTPAGDADVPAQIPAGLAAGTYTITFSCNPTLTASFTVDADGNIVSVTDSGGTTGGGGSIVDTGSNTTGTTLQIAAIALAAGLGMLGLAAIRRRSNTAAA
jgi:hypothetical protein